MHVTTHSIEKGADTSAPFGILLVNLGSPDAPTRSAVRRYLREFLSDKRVVDLPRWLWWPLLNWVILVLRPPVVAKLYQRVWRRDAPLREITTEQAMALQAELKKKACLVPVEIAMTYGNPSLQHGLLALRQRSVKRVLVLPLYPQFSSSTTASVFDRIGYALRSCRHIPDVRFVSAYYQHPLYIQALKNSVMRHWAVQGRGEKLLISFHGLPQRYVDEGDPYALQCEMTAKLLAAELELSDMQWQLVFQSRFGREPWLQPYLDDVLAQFAGQGLKKLDVVCPGFAADCLETLEEIALRSAEHWQQQGGEKLHYIPALNADADHMILLQALIAEHSQGWC